MPRSYFSAPRSSGVPLWRKRTVLGAQIAGGLALLAFVVLLITIYVSEGQLPSYDELKSSPNGQMIRVHAADGTVIVSIGPSYGEWLTYDRIPAVMRDAMVSVEDRRFRSHWGVDPVGVARSVQVRIAHGHWTQGGSTITQQLARNIFLNSNKKLGRKVREGILALALERKFSKDQILELYLNKVYFGGGAYGIDAASRKFFGHGADRLSLSEAAVIAGLVKAPSNYSPTADIDAARGRAGVVLKLMQETGAITPGQAAEAQIDQIKFVPEARQNSVRYFTDWALPQLELLIDETQRPLEVWTTLDLNMQRAADAAVQANAPKGAQGALVSIDRDGAVRAMVGGTDYVSSIYNRATQAQRQPGSSFKLFVYLAALEAGHKVEDSIVDEPVTIDGWSPRNDSRHNSGAVTLRTAFAYSLNTVAAKLGQEVGFSTVADMARRFGITTKVNTHPSMVLGTSDVRLIDMTRAFASVGNKGPSPPDRQEERRRRRERRAARERQSQRDVALQRRRARGVVLGLRLPLDPADENFAHIGRRRVARRARCVGVVAHVASPLHDGRPVVVRSNVAQEAAGHDAAPGDEHVGAPFDHGGPVAEVPGRRSESGRAQRPHERDVSHERSEAVARLGRRGIGRHRARSERGVHAAHRAKAVLGVECEHDRASDEALRDTRDRGVGRRALRRSRACSLGVHGRDRDSGPQRLMPHAQDLEGDLGPVPHDPARCDADVARDASRHQLFVDAHLGGDDRSVAPAVGRIAPSARREHRPGENEEERERSHASDSYGGCPAQWRRVRRTS